MKEEKAPVSEITTQNQLIDLVQKLIALETFLHASQDQSQHELKQQIVTLMNALGLKTIEEVNAKMLEQEGTYSDNNLFNPQSLLASFLTRFK